MKRMILLPLAAILTFFFGLAVDRVLVWKTHSELAVQTKAPEPVLVEVPAPVVTQVPVTESAESPSLLCDFNEDFQPDGLYQIKGSVPLEFKEFPSFELYTAENNGRISAYVSAGISQRGRVSYFSADFGLLTEKRLYFVTTESEEGIQYHFDGEFLWPNIVADAPAGKVVLKGTLTKTKLGQKIAERVVSYTVEANGC